ncbi:MAG TPA: alpha/beta fold hydrolase [Gemmatimonadaceae bacterium]|nr:alpha/beta fold hydrolase [Gemmatimonadaceae bacterium]
MQVRVGTIDCAYDDVGAGLPVIWLHGFPHNRKLWAPQLRALAGQCRCIAPDLRGFGESSIQPPYSMDQYADDIAQLLDALDVPRAVVGGLSMGGYVAFAIWRRHRDRVRGLILADTRAGADDDQAKRKRGDMMATAREHGAGAIADAMITGMLGKTSRAKQPDVVHAVYTMLASAPVDGIVGALDAMRSRADSTATLPTIDVPTLIIVGEEDVLTSPNDAMAMHAAIEGSRLEVIPRAGHVSNIERPAAFNHVVSDFLAIEQHLD